MLIIHEEGLYYLSSKSHIFSFCSFFLFITEIMADLVFTEVYLLFFALFSILSWTWYFWSHGGYFRIFTFFMSSQGPFFPPFFKLIFCLLISRQNIEFCPNFILLFLVYLYPWQALLWLLVFLFLFFRFLLFKAWQSMPPYCHLSEGRGHVSVRRFCISSVYNDVRESVSLLISVGLQKMQEKCHKIISQQDLSHTRGGVVQSFMWVRGAHADPPRTITQVEHPYVGGLTQQARCPDHWKKSASRDWTSEQTLTHRLCSLPFFPSDIWLFRTQLYF